MLDLELLILVGIALVACCGLLWSIIWQIQRKQSFTTHEKLLLEKLDIAEERATKMNQRLEALFRVNQISVDANQEIEVLEVAMSLALELTSVQGASFVPLDEHSQPIASTNFGVKPDPELAAWLQYLASPAIHTQCNACKELKSFDTCPLLVKKISSANNIFCFPLERGNRKFGILNLYVPKTVDLDADSQNFLQAMTKEITLAIDGVRFRRREFESLKLLQSIRAKSDINEMLTLLINNVCTSFESDFTVLMISESSKLNNVQKFYCGDEPDSPGFEIDKLMLDVFNTGKNFLKNWSTDSNIENVEGYSIMIVPLVGEWDAAIGSLLVGNNRNEIFSSRHLALLETIAGQTANLINNSHQIADIEYKTMIQERTRLAREIHDGLAQTLGYLKLHISQLKRNLELEKLDELRKDIEISLDIIGDAYEDAREAIDGLKIDDWGDDLTGWLQKTVSEFKDNNEIELVFNNIDPAIKLLPEVQIQLIRIVQEALSNVRKHADAKKLEIFFENQDDHIAIRIRDDGRGFEPETVNLFSRHGVQGMQERAELIDAEFDIFSDLGEGTTIVIQCKVGQREVLP